MSPGSVTRNDRFPQSGAQGTQRANNPHLGQVWILCIQRNSVDRKQQLCNMIWTGPWQQEILPTLFTGPRPWTQQGGFQQYAGPYQLSHVLAGFPIPYLSSQNGSVSKTAIVIHSKKPRPDSKARTLKGQHQPNIWLRSRWKILSYWRTALGGFQKAPACRLLESFNREKNPKILSGVAPKFISSKMMGSGQQSCSLQI